MDFNMLYILSVCLLVIPKYIVSANILADLDSDVGNKIDDVFSKMKIGEDIVGAVSGVGKLVGSKVADKIGGSVSGAVGGALDKALKSELKGSMSLKNVTVKNQNHFLSISNKMGKYVGAKVGGEIGTYIGRILISQFGLDNIKKMNNFRKEKLKDVIWDIVGKDVKNNITLLLDIKGKDFSDKFGQLTGLNVTVLISRFFKSTKQYKMDDLFKERLGDILSHLLLENKTGATIKAMLNKTVGDITKEALKYLFKEGIGSHMPKIFKKIMKL